MTTREARDFAVRWANGWNNRDLEVLLAYFAEDAVFSSPVALALTGNGTVVGKEALRAYWRHALETHHSLRFAVDRTFWNPACSDLAILYERHINGRHERAVEVLTFGPEGVIVRGEAFYGVATTRAPE